MKPITAEYILKSVNGTLAAGDSGRVITDVAIDSRKVLPGSLFVAIPGERADGHDFISMAAESGCSAVFASKLREEDCRLAREKGFAFIQVEDTVTALQELAQAYIASQPLLKVGVTGSTGKTTTKEMVWAVLSEKYNTVRNRLNLNNDIGLPLSAFQIEEATEAAVFEMGMDKLLEIHRLVEIVRPQTGIITNVGVTHIETLGSRENIFKAKMEITDYFGEDSTLIINNDSEPLKKNTCSGRWDLIRVGETFGSEERPEGGDILIKSVENHGEKGITFILERGGETQFYELPIPGVHNAHNAACAVAAGLAMGVSMKEAAAGLKKMESTDKRLNIDTRKGIKIIDDTYNANPDSMRAGLDTLAGMDGCRKVAILADMLGLGEFAEENHYELGNYASQKQLDMLISVGELAAHISRGAADGGGQTEVLHFDKKEDLEKHLSQLIREGDVVLVKGSRATAMDYIAGKIGR